MTAGTDRFRLSLDSKQRVKDISQALQIKWMRRGEEKVMKIRWELIPETRYSMAEESSGELERRAGG